jgi:hypothetical protein
MARWFLMFLLLALPFAARAIEAPPGQAYIDANKILRGRFVEAHQMNDAKGSAYSSGHFVVAPAHGLIWGTEKPIPTSTIITPNGLVQDIGGIAVKLPRKNLRHLYDMVGGALAGDWSGLENDFAVTRSGNADHWQMLLTPRQSDHAQMPYATITVSGGRFVENIVMARANGNYDMLSFTD